MHPLDAVVVFVHGTKQNAPFRRKFKVRTSIFRDRHRPQQPRDGEGPFVGDHVHPAGEIDRFRQHFVDLDRLDRPGLHVLHLAPVVDIHECQRSVSFRRIRLVRNHDFPLTRHHRTRFPDPETCFLEFRRERKERSAASVSRHENDLFAGRCEKMIHAERPRIRVFPAFRNVLDRLRVIRPQRRVEQHDIPLMLFPTMPRRERADDPVIASRDRFRSQHTVPRREIAVKDHLFRAVRIYRPEGMVRSPVPVHVLPPHVRDAPVIEKPRRVVLLHIGRDALNIRAVQLAFVERPDLRIVALNVPVRTGRTEDDLIVRRVRRLIVVPAGRRVVLNAVKILRTAAYLGRFQRLDSRRDRKFRILPQSCDLAQARPVQIHLKQTVVFFPLRQIRKDEFLSIVVDLRVAHVPFRVLKDLSARFRLHVEDPDRASGVPRKRHPARIVRIVADVRVPVHVGTWLPGHEKDLLRHPVLLKLRNETFHRRRLRFRSRLCSLRSFRASFRRENISGCQTNENSGQHAKQYANRFRYPK